MVFYEGPRWRGGVAHDGWVEAQGARVVAEGEGPAPRRAVRALLLDGLVDFHTHVGDAFLRGGPVPRDLAAAVAPGTGFKHAALASASSATVEAGIRAHLEALAGGGVVDVLDFREQGVDGIRAARRASKDVAGLRLRLLGRTTDAGDEREDAAVLAEADGLGLPSLSDLGPAACERLRRAAKKAGKPFALHVSEARREDIEAVLGLEPDLLVHLCAATEADLRLVADAGVPVVVCPSSNEHFRLRPPTASLERLGIPWFLGTDNAMLGHHDLVAEAARVHAASSEVPDASFARALTTSPEKAINRFGRLEQRVSSAQRLLVLPTGPRGHVKWAADALVLDR